MQDNIIADRMAPYLQLQMYAKFTQLAVKNSCVNMGQGFPNFPPPQFLRQAIAEEALTESLQYTITAGHPRLLKAAADFFEKHMGVKVDTAKEIVASSGAQSVLACVFQALLNPDDEVICFDPAFDFYRPLIEFQGAKHVGVPLKPGQLNSKASILNRFENGKIKFSKEDEWHLDYEYLEQRINAKTKMVILNSPQNPIGKVFSVEELDRLAEILEKHPQIIVCEDAAYHHVVFGGYQPFSYPRCFTHPKLKSKTVCVTSAGKMFSATGLRIGFAMGDEKYIKAIKSAQTYHNFCLNPVLQTATAKCLEQTIDGQYFTEIRDLYEEQSTMLLKGLLESRLNLHCWVPQGGYFLVTDISDVDIPEKYFKDDQDGHQLTKDFAFAYYMACEIGVVCIPCSPYFENKELGSRFVRWAFCKTTETIQDACNRLK
ncbi:unnamed protein product [Paramecium octaurelia]|uniref:Aminotransferase class I/classII large domain-containing protein n=1 Tax=Paramecium octaurelia TaxID=43137 RepID=A0A8S1VNE2_PAROT|nr:unnamed protein product [Paramecium octaurelia]